MGNRLTATLKAHPQLAATLAVLVNGGDSFLVACGLAVIIVGVAMISTPAAVVLAGVFVTMIGVGRMRA